MKLYVAWMIVAAFENPVCCGALSVLESGTISVFIPGKKYGEEADQQLSFPVQCSLWAFTDASHRSGRAENALLGAAVSFFRIVCTAQLKHDLDI